MKQVTTISISDLQKMAERMFGTLVKADVDVRQKIIVVAAELHADIEAFMLENGSQQNDLWGINLHHSKFGTDDFIEYDSMINIRPRQGNMSRYVEDDDIRQQIAEIVSGVVHE